VHIAYTDSANNQGQHLQQVADHPAQNPDEITWIVFFEKKLQFSIPDRKNNIWQI
jgi:hypothetical protein